MLTPLHILSHLIFITTAFDWSSDDFIKIVKLGEVNNLTKVT